MQIWLRKVERKVFWFNLQDKILNEERRKKLWKKMQVNQQEGSAGDGEDTYVAGCLKIGQNNLGPENKKEKQTKTEKKMGPGIW